METKFIKVNDIDIINVACITHIRINRDFIGKETGITITTNEPYYLNQDEDMSPCFYRAKIELLEKLEKYMI